MRPRRSRPAQVLALGACALTALLSAAGCHRTEKAQKEARPPATAPHARAAVPAATAEPVDSAEREGRRKPHVERKHVVLSPWDPRKGAKEAKVTIVEFCDFECPYCLELAPKLRKIEAERGKDVAVVFKTMPLTNVHEHAMGAALAFQAAHRQGKAWALHDKMFANQGALTKPDIEKYARELHLDMARFHKDMSDPKVKEEVDADAKQEGPLGVCCYTPRVFINGRLVNAQMKLEGYEAIVDEEIKNAEELVEAGTPLADVYRKFTEH